MLGGRPRSFCKKLRKEKRRVIPPYQKIRRLLITCIFRGILTIRIIPIQFFETVTLVTLVEVRDTVGEFYVMGEGGAKQASEPSLKPRKKTQDSDPLVLDSLPLLAPKLWNKLPVALRTTDSLQTAVI